MVLHSVKSHPRGGAARSLLKPRGDFTPTGYHALPVSRSLEGAHAAREPAPTSTSDTIHTQDRAGQQFAKGQFFTSALLRSQVLLEHRP